MRPTQFRRFVDNPAFPVLDLDFDDLFTPPVTTSTSEAAKSPMSTKALLGVLYRKRNDAVVKYARARKLNQSEYWYNQIQRFQMHINRVRSVS